MQDEPRITDSAPLLAAARTDAGQEKARVIRLTLGELWRLIHRAPTLAIDPRQHVKADLAQR